MKSHSLLQKLGLVVGVSLASAFVGNDLLAQRHQGRSTMSPSKRTYVEDEYGRTTERILEYDNNQDGIVDKREVTEYFYDSDNVRYKELTSFDIGADGTVDEYVDVIREFFSNEDVTTTSYYGPNRKLICATKKIYFEKFLHNGEIHYKNCRVAYDRDGDGIFEEDVSTRL